MSGVSNGVCELYNTIARDDRHSEVRLLAYEEVAEQRLLNWTVEQVNSIEVVNRTEVQSELKRMDGRFRSQLVEG